jgi:carbon monoxide dehydrogenase subunit G
MTIEIRETIYVASSVDEVWGFLNDIHTVAECMPTVVRYEVDADEVVHCDLKIKLGLIPLDSTARVQITDRDVNRRLEVKGETSPGTHMLKQIGKLSEGLVTGLHIIADLEEVSPEKTRVCFTLLADAKGQLRRIYNSVIKSQRDKLLSQLLVNIEKAFGVKVVLDETASVFL